MDSRVDPIRILDALPGEIHVIRNAGGVVTDDVLRSLAVSQHRLGTRQVMVMMHTDCAMLGLRDDAERDRIADETGERPPFPLGGFSDLKDRLAKSVDAVRSSGFLRHTDSVTGAVYDVGQDRLNTII
jgi:carbonic anhydrase